MMSLIQREAPSDEIRIPFEFRVFALVHAVVDQFVLGAAGCGCESEAGKGQHHGQECISVDSVFCVRHSVVHQGLVGTSII